MREEKWSEWVAGWLCLLLMIPVGAQGQSFLTSIDQVTTGCFRVYSLAYNQTMAMSETTTGSNNVFCELDRLPKTADVI